MTHRLTFKPCRNIIGALQPFSIDLQGVFTNGLWWFLIQCVQRRRCATIFYTGLCRLLWLRDWEQDAPIIYIYKKKGPAQLLITRSHGSRRRTVLHCLSCARKMLLMMCHDINIMHPSGVVVGAFCLHPLICRPDIKLHVRQRRTIFFLICGGGDQHFIY